VWNGEELRTTLKYNVESPSRCDLVRSVWKYGLPPWRFRHAVLFNLEKWGPFAWLRTFDSVVKELEDFGLNGLIFASAEIIFGTSVLCLASSLTSLIRGLSGI
jgi:hypothetical protein